MLCRSQCVTVLGKAPLIYRKSITVTLCLLHAPLILWVRRCMVVKNGFSNPTKVQEGRDQPRKDVMNRHRGKDLSEGCHERKKARMVVPSREKINNNKNLARATTKSKSEMQTVSNGRVGRGGGDKGFEERPNIGDLIE